MKRAMLIAAVGIAALAAALPFGWDRFAQAQPAKGAPAAFQRVQDVMVERFKSAKLSGDPDKDFAALLIASYEELIYLAKTELDYGADRELRQIAEKISDEQQNHIDVLKRWQVRRAEADYKAQPDRAPPGSGPLDRQAMAVPAPAQPPAPAQAAVAAPEAAAAKALPAVSGKVEKVDLAAGKVTLEHGPIPNLNMDGMTMAWRVQDPAVLKGLKKGDKVQFSADRVNGSLTVTKIQKAK